MGCAKFYAVPSNAIIAVAADVYMLHMDHEVQMINEGYHTGFNWQLMANTPRGSMVRYQGPVSFTPPAAWNYA